MSGPRRAQPRAWPGIVAGLLGVAIGVGFAVAQVIPDPFSQTLIIAGLLLVSGTHVGLLVIAQRRLGPALQALTTPEKDGTP